MVETNVVLRQQEKPKTHISESRRFFKVIFSRWLVVFGSIIIILLIVTAIFAPLIAPYNPYKVNLPDSMQQPSVHHLLGTDEMGRDVLSRIIYGSRIAVMVGFVVVIVAGVIGMLLGLFAGYFGGWVETIIMRCMDALMSLPPLVLMLAIAVMLGGGLTKVFVALAVAFMPTYCRLMCGEVLSTKENDYVMAANVIGANDFRIMFRHLVPNVFPPLFVNITLDLGFAILSEASLSFLGIGINPPTATWGAMINNGQHYLLTNPLLSIAPGMAIVLVVLAFNLVGDGLRDALDPRLRGRI
jgi:peptide/nickel transport system permease protein/oligopeptide transport system permease protein